METHRTPDSVLDFERKEVNNMAKIPKLIKALLNFSDALPEQLLNQGYAVLKGLTGNANFTTLPIDLALLKTTLDAYSAAIADARDGSKKAIALRDRLGGDVIRMLKGLALYVELNCKEDMNTFLSSGFQPRSSTRMPAQPLDQPVVLYYRSGQLRRTAGFDKGRSWRENLRRALGTSRRRRGHTRLMVDEDGCEDKAVHFNRRPDPGYDVCDSGTCVRPTRPYRVE